MGTITISHGDNFKFIEDKTIDFILTDPPFNISKETNFSTYEKNKVHSFQFDGESSERWDSYEEESFLQLLEKWCVEWSRVLRRGGNFAIFCADTYLSDLWRSLEKAGLHPRRVMVWRKNNAVPVNRKVMPMSACEYFIVGVKGNGGVFNSTIDKFEENFSHQIVEANIVADKVATIVNSRLREELLKSNLRDDCRSEAIGEIIARVLRESENEIIDRVDNLYKTHENGYVVFEACVPNYIQYPLKTGVGRIHPTEKPIALLQYLLSLYSKENELVLDSFSGSGSTAEAAYRLNRNSILVEREKTFYEKSLLRLEAIVREKEELIVL